MASPQPQTETVIYCQGPSVAYPEMASEDGLVCSFNPTFPSHGVTAEKPQDEIDRG
jgi:hypothetical protein